MQEIHQNSIVKIATLIDRYKLDTGLVYQNIIAKEKSGI